MKIAGTFFATLLFGLMGLSNASPPASKAAAPQQISEPQNALAPDDLHDATLRQIVHLSVGGATLPWEA